MDPVAQTLAQQSSGSAEGQGFGSYYIQGRQLNQNQQNINLSSRRVAVEEAQNKRQQDEFDILKPYLADNARNRAANLGIEVDLNRAKLDAQTQLNAALPDIYNMQAAIAQSPDGVFTPGMLETLLKNSLRNGKAYAPGMPGGDLWIQAEAGPVFESRMKRILDAREKLKGTGTTVTSTDARGMPVLGVDKSGQPLSQIGKEEYDIQQKWASGDYEGAVELQRARDTKKAGVESEVGRRITEYEKRTGAKLPDEEVKRMYEIAGGITPRAAVTHTVTEGEYIAKHIDKAMDQKTVIDAKTKKGRRPASRQEAVEALRKEFREQVGSGPPATAPKSTAAPEEKVYMKDKDGNIGQVPASQVEDAKKQGFTLFEG